MIHCADCEFGKKKLIFIAGGRYLRILCSKDGYNDVSGRWACGEFQVREDVKKYIELHEEVASERDV